MIKSRRGKALKEIKAPMIMPHVPTDDEWLRFVLYVPLVRLSLAVARVSSGLAVKMLKEHVDSATRDMPHCISAYQVKPR
jgi:hypothetical protein